MFGRIYALNLN